MAHDRRQSYEGACACGSTQGGNQDTERTKKGGTEHEATHGRGCAWYAGPRTDYIRDALVEQARAQGVQAQIPRRKKSQGATGGL